MAKQRRSLLAKTKRTAERAQQRVAGPTATPSEQEPLEPVSPSPEDAPNPTLTPTDAEVQAQPTEEPAPQETAKEAPPAVAPEEAPPVPNLGVEQPVDAPTEARDMAQAEKAGHDDFAEFSKDVSTANPTPERAEGPKNDVFPKDFDDGDDWFTRTGQPAPPRALAEPEEDDDAPIVTKQTDPWPVVLIALGIAGVIGFGLLLLIFMS